MSDAPSKNVQEAELTALAPFVPPPITPANQAQYPGGNDVLGAMGQRKPQGAWTEDQLRMEVQRLQSNGALWSSPLG